MKCEKRVIDNWREKGQRKRVQDGKKDKVEKDMKYFFPLLMSSLLSV